MRRASTDATRKIATLRRWAARGVSEGRAAYLAEIAAEMEAVYNLMLDARRTLMVIEKHPRNRRVAALATRSLENRVP